MKRMALLGVALLASSALLDASGDAAEKPTRPPLPKPKPVELSLESPDVAAPPAPVIPRPKPARAAEPDSDPQTEEPPPDTEAQPVEDNNAEPVPEKTEPSPPRDIDAQPAEDDKPEPGEDFALCRAELARLGAQFSVPEMPASEGRCKVANPVRITAITTPAGDVAFPENPILNCIFAKRFTSWVSDIAGPVVKTHTGSDLAAIATGPGYQCRNRNGDVTAKISEHALGNAIDIAAFRLSDKRSMAVTSAGDNADPSSRVLTALRVSACGYFTTVLGPGSNAAHAEHYHFDLGLHGKSGNYRICE